MEHRGDFVCRQPRFASPSGLVSQARKTRFVKTFGPLAHAGHTHARAPSHDSLRPTFGSQEHDFRAKVIPLRGRIRTEAARQFGFLVGRQFQGFDRSGHGTRNLTRKPYYFNSFRKPQTSLSKG